MSKTQQEKAQAFRALHAGPGPFIIANCWDDASARILGGPGFSALATGRVAAAGVRRISLATSLYRAAMRGLMDAALEVRDSGTFGFVDRAMSSGELARYLGR